MKDICIFACELSKYMALFYKYFCWDTWSSLVKIIFEIISLQPSSFLFGYLYDGFGFRKMCHITILRFNCSVEYHTSNAFIDFQLEIMHVTHYLHVQLQMYQLMILRIARMTNNLGIIRKTDRKFCYWKIGVIANYVN